MNLYLGVDAGGSYCRCRLTDARGVVIGTGQGGPANARIGVGALRNALETVTQEAIRNAGLSAEQVRSIHAGMGIAGISRPGIREALHAFDLPFASTRYETDAYIANLGANAGGDGAILILGTGSIGLIKQGDVTSTIGGYGFPISDEGSGAALGLSAMRHALRALDGRTQATQLSAAVTKQFDHHTAQVIAWMDQAAPADYASFAPLVMDFADKGDAIARSIVEDAALHVERFIETIFERGASRCVLLGGLAARMRPWLRERIANRISEARGDALTGALYLAGLPVLE